MTDMAEPQVSIENLEDTPTETLTASELAHQFFTQHNIIPKLTYVDSLNTWVGDGYVLNDKPLLKISYEFKDNS